MPGCLCSATGSLSWAGEVGVSHEAGLPPRGVGVRVPCPARVGAGRAVPTLGMRLQPLRLSVLVCVVGALPGLGRGEAGSELRRQASGEAVLLSGVQMSAPRRCVQTHVKTQACTCD